MHWFWLGATYISQAGVALGLAFEIKSRFTRWGDDFATLVLSVVVINQLIGPPLCKLGLLRLGVSGIPDTDEAAEARRIARAHSENIDEFYHSPSLLRRLHPRGGAKMLDLTGLSGQMHWPTQDNDVGGSGVGGDEDSGHQSVSSGAAGSLRQVRKLLHRPVVTLDIIEDPTLVGGGGTASSHRSPEAVADETHQDNQGGPAGDTGSRINVDMHADSDHNNDDSESDNDDNTLLRVLSQPGTRLRLITTDTHMPASPLRPALSRSSSAYGSLGASRSVSGPAFSSPTAFSRSLSDQRDGGRQGGEAYLSQPSGANGTLSSSHNRTIIIRSPSASFRKRLQGMHAAAAAVHETANHKGWDGGGDADKDQ